ncbi:MAG: hypothetical protein QOF61_2213, partial [Acidobacteriota bacterium]|nr:hypothetical protein [Acidobacteriota bacterium]
DLDEGNLYRQPGEADLLFRYMQHHDMASRALDLYLEVVRRFPKTRAARDALYTAAVCHERLANYNNYWRDKYATGLHAGERMVTYADVRAAYPDYRLPRATMGWQPSTRTVNGKPGWDAPPKPPKPKPKPTRSQRAKLYAARAYSWLRQQWLDLWEGWLKRWLAATLLTICALRCHRFASRARVRLREQLVRLKPTHTCEPINETDSADTRNAITADAHAATLLPAPVAPWLVEEGSGMSRTERAAILARRLVSRGVNMARDGATLARRASRPAWRRVEPLLHDAHGRSVLAANAVSHGLLVVLLVELLRIMYAG